VQLVADSGTAASLGLRKTLLPTFHIDRGMSWEAAVTKYSVLFEAHKRVSC
jgi:hypothetical protein